MSLLDIYFFTVASLSLILIFLSYNVINYRRKYRVLYGANQHVGFTAAIRAQANFIEYVPFILILFAGLIYFEIPKLLFGFLCLLLLIARLSHLIGILKYERLDPPYIKPRFWGMLGTFSIILFSSLYIVISIMYKLFFN